MMMKMIQITTLSDSIQIDDLPYIYTKPIGELGGISTDRNQWQIDKTSEIAFEIKLILKKEKLVTDREFDELCDKFHHEVMEMKTEPPPRINIPYTLTTPAECQERAAGMILRDKRCEIAFDPGVGKTACVIYAINKMIRDQLDYNIENEESDDILFKVLITCPKRVCNQWKQEFKKHSRLYETFETLVLKDGSVKKKAETLSSFLNKNHPRTMVIVNHDAIWRSPLWQLIKKCYWDMIMVDECHRLGQPGGKFSMAVGRKSKFIAEYVVGLTGTPFPFHKLYGQGRLLSNNHFGTNFNVFKSQYCLSSHIDNAIGGYKNLTKLMEKFYSFAYRVSLDEVVDLPSQRDEIFYVNLSPGELKIYNELRKDYISQLEDGVITASNAAVKLMRLIQTCQGHSRTEDGDDVIFGDTKLKALESFIDDFPEDEKLVIFYLFTPDGQRIYEMLKKKGKRIGVIASWQDDYEKWQGDEIDIMVAQETAAALGLDSLKTARYAYDYSFGYSPITYKQKRARIMRRGQERSVVYYHLIARGTVEEIYYNALTNELDAIDAVLDEIRR